MASEMFGNLFVIDENPNLLGDIVIDTHLCILGISSYSYKERERQYITWARNQFGNDIDAYKSTLNSELVAGQIRRFLLFDSHRTVLDLYESLELNKVSVRRMHENNIHYKRIILYATRIKKKIAYAKRKYINDIFGRHGVFTSDVIYLGHQELSEKIKDPCAICLTEYKRKDCARLNNCKHELCCSCAQKWIPTHKSCPLCRIRTPIYTIYKPMAAAPIGGQGKVGTPIHLGCRRETENTLDGDFISFS